MRIGIVCPYDWSHPGGVRTHITGLTNALRKRGIDVEIISPASDSEPDVYAVGRGFPVPYNGSVARICFSYSSKRRIASRLKLNDLDLLHVHEPFSPSASFLAVLESDVPVVATFHASRPRSRAYAAAAPIITRLDRKISEHIVVSEASKKLVAAYLPVEFHIIPNGIDYSKYRAATPDRALKPLEPFALFVGRSEPRKGFQVMLDAMEIVREDLDLRLVVAGMQKEDDREWVHHLGKVDYAALPSVYASAAVFCAPSLGSEGFGLVLIEAMAAGTPVVASSIPGYLEAGKGAALFAAPGDTAGIAAGILSILKDEKVRTGAVAAGLRRAAELDWDLIAERLIPIYERAMMNAN